MARNPTRFKLGGARNYKANSSAITFEQCQGVIDAYLRAARQDKPFNIHVTLTWWIMGIGPEFTTDATGKFIALARDWLRSKGYAMPWVFAQEVGRRHGEHSHILLHVPPELVFAFHRRWWAWKRILREKFGGPVDRRQRISKVSAKKAVPIGDKPYTFQSDPESYLISLKWIISYILKGAPQPVLDRLGIGRHHKPSGRIVGKRVGWWQERRSWG